MGYASIRPTRADRHDIGAGQEVFSHSEWARKRYAENPEYRRRRNENNRAYRAVHKAEINERRRQRRRNPEYREKQENAQRLRNRRKSKLEVYGITLEDYNAMLVRQGGVCEICKKQRPETLCIDHCHSTGKVRGLLCRNCNSALGFYEDDPRVTRAATVYLEAAHGEQQP